ncbi:RND transporter [Azoarcus taiwanensis]|uniref:RND transporter n=2 Tax=Azoarcus taiwanensis TaxID=666964 RepID=A0A972J9K7_9RHOO|nr:RND transporter [Azoarcus taiwanensis]
MWKMTGKTLAAMLATTLISVAAHADGHLPEVEAEVRRIDQNAGKITLRHGNIPNLDMPPMTMVFQVEEKALLDGIAVGDQVVVTIEQVEGAYTLKSIRTHAP